MFRVLYVLALLAFTAPAYAQLSVPKEVEQYAPIIATVEAKTLPGLDTQITWRRSSDKVQYEARDTNSTLFIWAPPGDHWIEATVATQKYEEVEVLIPDPSDPKDISKAKLKKLRIALSFSLDRYQANFKVKGTSPAPVVPDPIVPVIPVVAPSAELQLAVAPLKAIMVKSDPAKVVIWAGAWDDFLVTFKTSPTPIQSTAAFKSSITAFMNAAATRAGLANAFPGYSAELEKAFVSRFGSEDTALNQTAATEFLSALIWACKNGP